MNDNDKEKFKDAIYLCPTNDDVNKKNIECLIQQKQPIAKIQSENKPDVICPQHKTINEGVPQILYLSVGCKIMLRKNLWTKGGLVNGSQGIVHGIIYAEGQQSPDIPSYILVKFDKYNGPTLVDGLFPIKPITVTWTHNYMTYTRKQLPIVLSYAVTIHKSRGLTMDNVVIDIGKDEMTCGISYVAITRVRNLENLMFRPFFRPERLKLLYKKDMYKNRNEFLI